MNHVHFALGIFDYLQLHDLSSVYRGNCMGSLAYHASCSEAFILGPASGESAEAWNLSNYHFGHGRFGCNMLAQSKTSWSMHALWLSGAQVMQLLAGSRT